LLRCLQGFIASFAGADADHVCNVSDKNLAVAGFALGQLAADLIDQLFCLQVILNGGDFDFGRKLTV